jgi:hypothetical protein
VKLFSFTKWLILAIKRNTSMFLHFRFPHPKKIGISNLLKFLFLGAGQHVAKKTFFPFLKINLEGGWIPVIK